MSNRTCYTVILGKPDGENIGLIKEGESGYYLTDYAFGDTAEQTVRMLNDRHGIGEDVQRALELGSMFGWDIPACAILK